LPSEEVLRNRESVEAELELGGLRLLWEAFENLTGDEVERVRLTAVMAGWAATVVVMMAGVGGVMEVGAMDGSGNETDSGGEGGVEKYGERARRKIRGVAGARLLCMTSRKSEQT
jgi:hypothetical protein